jgi:hypothetical protein
MEQRLLPFEPIESKHSDHVKCEPCCGDCRREFVTRSNIPRKISQSRIADIKAAVDDVARFAAQLDWLDGE